MNETKFIGNIKTIGEDSKEYTIYVYQDFIGFIAMGETNKTFLPGTIRPILQNGYHINKLSNDKNYDFQIVETNIKLKILN